MIIVCTWMIRYSALNCHTIQRSERLVRSVVHLDQQLLQMITEAGLKTAAISLITNSHVRPAAALSHAEVLAEGRKR